LAEKKSEGVKVAVSKEEKEDGDKNKKQGKVEQEV
jgi:hypothetical protein